MDVVPAILILARTVEHMSRFGPIIRYLNLWHACSCFYSQPIWFNMNRAYAATSHSSYMFPCFWFIYISFVYEINHAHGSHLGEGVHVVLSFSLSFSNGSSLQEQIVKWSDSDREQPPPHAIYCSIYFDMPNFVFSFRSVSWFLVFFSPTINYVTISFMHIYYNNFWASVRSLKHLTIYYSQKIIIWFLKSMTFHTEDIVFTASKGPILALFLWNFIYFLLKSWFVNIVKFRIKNGMNFLNYNW